LFESSGDHKHKGISDIMDAFMDAKFLFFGDSGEQDLELYVDIARQRPRQVLGVFIRDVTSGILRDIQGALLTRNPSSDRKALRSKAQPPNVGPMSADSATNGVEADSDRKARDRLPVSTSPASSTEDLGARLADIEALTAAQGKILKRAALWEARVAIAKRDIPKETVLIFFQEPEEISFLVHELFMISR